ncbi:MAG: glycosyltransferase [Thermoplasmatales archaeon]
MMKSLSNSSARQIIYAIKSFHGEPRGGSQIVFNKCLDVLSEKYILSLIAPFENIPLVSGNGIKVNVKRTIIRAYKILKINLIANKLIRSGKSVFGETKSCSIVYFQPPAEDKFPFVLDVLIEHMLNIVDVLSRKWRDNRELVIYNSKFTMDKFRVKKKGALEQILLPGIVPGIPRIEIKDKEKPLILTISRISREKNLEAIQNIIKGIRCEHIIIGYCSDFKYLETLKFLLPNSKIIANATSEEKNAMLRKARILLHTAINEPAGLVYMEAMSFGVIPLAHDSGGSREIVPEEYRYTNYEEANLKIKQYINSYDEGVMLNLQEVSRHYTEESFRNNLLDIMQNFLPSKN